MNINILSTLCRIPLLGQIPRSTIAIAVGYDSVRKIIRLLFYFEKSPSETEQETLFEITNEVYSTAIDSGFDIENVISEYKVVNDAIYCDLDPLDGWLFALQGNPV